MCFYDYDVGEDNRLREVSYICNQKPTKGERAQIRWFTSDHNTFDKTVCPTGATLPDETECGTRIAPYGYVERSVEDIVAGCKCLPNQVTFTFPEEASIGDNMTNSVGGPRVPSTISVRWCQPAYNASVTDPGGDVRVVTFAPACYIKGPGIASQAIDPQDYENTYDSELRSVR